MLLYFTVVGPAYWYIIDVVNYCYDNHERPRNSSFDVEDTLIMSKGIIISIFMRNFVDMTVLF